MKTKRTRATRTGRIVLIKDGQIVKKKRGMAR